MAIVNENLFRSIPRTTKNCKQNYMIKCELLNEKKKIFFFIYVQKLVQIAVIIKYNRIKCHFHYSRSFIPIKCYSLNSMSGKQIK